MLVYNLLLFAHILGVVGLFVALSLDFVMSQRLHRSMTVASVREWTSLVPFLGVIHPVVSVVILLSGVAMLLLRFGLEQPWAGVSLVLLIVLAAVGGGVRGPRLVAIRAAAQQTPDGPVPAPLAQRLSDPILETTARMMNPIAVGLVLVMTVKPDLLVTLVVVAVAALVGLIWARLSAAAEYSLVARTDSAPS